MSLSFSNWVKEQGERQFNSANWRLRHRAPLQALRVSERAGSRGRLGAPATGAARETHYGQAYALSLVVSIAFTLAALTMAILDVRRRRVPAPVAA